jgi:hypothetical protein
MISKRAKAAVAAYTARRGVLDLIARTLYA